MKRNRPWSRALAQVGGNLRVGVVGRIRSSQWFRFFHRRLVGSWSITRPRRPELLASSISAMIFGSVSAPDSIAPVSG